MTHRIARAFLFLILLGRSAFCQSLVDKAVHIPILVCRVEVPKDFTPDAPCITVVYSNSSPSNAIRITVPGDEYERKLLVPAVRFDGCDGVFSDPGFNDGGLPRHGTFVEPGQEVRVDFAISERYVVPTNWQSISVIPGHQLQLVMHEFTFARDGQLVSVKEYDRRDIDEMRQNILRVPRIRKALLEDTLRVPRPPAGAESGGTTTAVPPAAGSAGPAETSSRQSGRAGITPTNGAVKDAAVQPIQTPQSGLPWGILAAGAVVAAAAVFALVRSMRNRNAKAEATDN